MIDITEASLSGSESTAIEKEIITVDNKKSADIFKKIFAKSKENVPTTKTLKWNSEEIKENDTKKEWNIKIVTWNINGIRAWIEVNLTFF